MTDSTYLMECPWCHVVYSCHEFELNCEVFRCGFYKNTLQQIDPHMDEGAANKLKDDGMLAVGCSRQFYLEDKRHTVRCTGR